MTEHFPPLSCSEARDALGELALGTLTGRERSAVLAHAGICSRCGAELAQLIAVSDSILHLAPEAEPPVGFELRLARRLEADHPRRRRHHFRPRLQWAAAVVALAIGLGVGLAITLGGGNNTTRGHVAAAPLVSGSRTVGEVLMVYGKPTRLLMTVDSDTTLGIVRCQVGLADGKVDTVGWFALSDGYGAWHVTLPAYASPVRTARLVASNGKVIGRARFTS